MQNVLRVRHARGKRERRVGYGLCESSMSAFAGALPSEVGPGARQALAGASIRGQCRGKEEQALMKTEQSSYGFHVRPSVFYQAGMLRV